MIAALGTGVHKCNPIDIVTICNATPNPRVAFEMLLNVYDEVDMAKFPKFYKSRHSFINNLYEVIEVNELMNQYTIMVYEPNTKKVWYSSKYDLCNGIYSEEKLESYTDTRDIIDYTGYSKHTHVLNLDDLNSYLNISIDEFTTELMSFTALITENAESEILKTSIF